MIDYLKLRQLMDGIAAEMSVQKKALIELDQKTGDGDLGISMADGFAAASAAVRTSSEKDLGKLFMIASKAMNEAAPSSLGTIMSLLMMGMAKSLKGNENAEMPIIIAAFENGIGLIESRTGSIPGEKTMLDALVPAILAMRENENQESKVILQKAADAADVGAESTKEMKAVHGRAAYYGDKTIGLLDGGAVTVKYIFGAIAKQFC